MRSVSNSIKSCPRFEPCVKRALSPLPSAFLDIVYYLLCQSDIALRALGANIVKNDGFAVAWSFRQSHVSGNNGCEDLRAKKISEVRHYLRRKIRSLVKHRKQKPLNRQARIYRSAYADQRVPKLGDAFQGKVLALNRYQDRIRSCQCIKG